MIVPIVEGSSEVESIPVLMRRLLNEWGISGLDIGRPFRVKRHQIVRDDRLEKAIEAVRTARPGVRAAMLVLDADDDCPKELAPALLARAQKTAAGTLDCFVVLPKYEIEAWFLAGVETLKGSRGIRVDSVPPDNPESIRDAKGRLTEMMEGRTYISVDDQPAFAQLFDLQGALQRCRSFRKFWKDFREIASNPDDTAKSSTSKITA